MPSRYELPHYENFIALRTVEDQLPMFLLFMEEIIFCKYVHDKPLARE